MKKKKKATKIATVYQSDRVPAPWSMSGRALHHGLLFVASKEPNSTQILMQGQRFVREDVGMALFFNTKVSNDIFVVLRKCLEGLSNSGVFHCKWLCRSIYSTLGCDPSRAKKVPCTYSVSIEWIVVSVAHGNSSGVGKEPSFWEFTTSRSSTEPGDMW